MSGPPVIQHQRCCFSEMFGDVWFMTRNSQERAIPILQRNSLFRVETGLSPKIQVRDDFIDPHLRFA